MSGHTPGPWIAQADPDARLSDDWVVGIAGAPIDYVATCSKRDAPLIAAAPLLLEACLLARHICEPGNALQQQIDAAIYAATGEAA